MSAPSAPTRLVSALLAVLLTLTGLVTLADPARAEESYWATPAGTIGLTGSGWGHGVGMSQYGAKTGADGGATAHQILGFYYPGATLAAGPTAPVRVLLSRWDGAGSCTSTPPASTPCLRVLAEPGQVATDRSSGAQVLVPTSIGGVPVASVAVGTSTSGLSVWAWAGGWKQLSPTVFAGPVDISSADGVQRGQFPAGDLHDYRGALRVVRASATTIQRVNVVALEQYLLGVVPSEMPASWSTAAVQAQGVAARTYAAAAMASAGSRSYDLCDTTACQVYGGVAAESSTATAKLASAAPSDVRGAVLTTGGVPITAFFSSSNGGHTVSGGTGYLPARPDPWDPATEWTRTVSGTCLAARYPGRGSFTRLVVLARDGGGRYGGRVTTLRLEFSGGTVTIGGGSSAMANDAAIRGAFYGCGDSAGLRSSMFAVTGSASPFADLAMTANTASSIEFVVRQANRSLVHRYWTPTTGVSTAVALGGESNDTPAIARGSATTQVAAVVGTNQIVYVNTRSATGVWSGWSRVDGITARGRPGLALAADGTLHLVVAGSDNQVWHAMRPAGGAWSGWRPVGGAVGNGGGVSATAGPDGVWIAVRGTDAKAWAKRYTGGAWSGWVGLGGVLDGDPAIARDAGTGVTWVVVRGSDRAGWVIPTTGGPWRALGGELANPPVADGPDDAPGIQVVVLGTNGGLYRLVEAGGTWGGWSRIG